jgi:glutathione S-transferase
LELTYSSLSPFVRKVLVVAHELGLNDRIRRTPINVREEPDKIAPLNPLGKIPVLVTDSGEAIYDSPVICEYLDAEFGGRRFLPGSGARRWAIMTRAAMADGLLDAALLVRHERLRPAVNQSADWIEWQLRKVNAALDRLEGEVPGFGDQLDMGLVAVGCAVGYVPVRLEDYAGLARWPGLKAWHDALLRRPSFQSTAPVVAK